MISTTDIRNKVIDQIMAIKDADFLRALSDMMERAHVQENAVQLTEEQKPKVDEVNKEYLQALATTRKEEASRLEKYNTLKQLRSTRDEKLKAILTEEQYAIYQDDQQERRKQLRERRRANR